ncbi:tyrosine-type recombinase/integrase [Schlesneria sp.]|uniref:tyrosine-type recombinase/integrase n=1 Tax=Schlesneria sp. TaxID=2762018 RepID=UPI002F1F103B
MKIKVTLVDAKKRRYILARWIDPISRKPKSRSTGVTTMREAERFAAKLELELNAGEFVDDTFALWQTLRSRYLEEVSAHKRLKTRLKTTSMFNAIDEHFAPKFVAGVADPNFISKFSSKLRSLGRSIHTVRGHLAELRKVLRWAKRMRMVAVMPHIEFPAAPDGMKGRPITQEEFERMKAAIKTGRWTRKWKRRNGKIVTLETKIIPEQFEECWEYYLEGLWLSSLRLEESLVLHWTSDEQIMADFSGRYPMFRIQAAAEKGKRFRLLPMAPDFADFLQDTPEHSRKGYVFKPLSFPSGRKTGDYQHRPTHEYCGKVITALGKAANVRVNQTKFASAHDFRRAFGYRWAMKVRRPVILKELMRHENIETTMEFYVGDLAEDAAKEVWQAVDREAPSRERNNSQLTD